MTIFQAILLGLVEGVTEFLPVSSTAHLIVLQRLFGFTHTSLFFNTVVQLGALFGLIVAEWKVLRKIFFDFLEMMQRVAKRKQKISSISTNTLFMIGTATLPIIAGGLILSSLIDTIQDSLLPIVFTSIGVGLVLLLAEKKAGSMEKKVTLSTVVLMGVAQVFALIPGTSRSGIVAAAGMFTGMNRSQALEYSFLLSIPALSLAGIYELLHVFKDVTITSEILLPTFVAMVTAFISSLLVVNILRSVVRHIGFVPFVIYRIVFGLGILLFLL